MHKNNYFSFNKEKKSSSNLKLYLSALLIILIISSVIVYELLSYKLLMKNFTAYFDKNNFSAANRTIITEENFNIFKSILLERDLSIYLNNKLDSLSDSLSKNEISLNDALNISKEIYRYDLTLIDDTTLFIDSNNEEFNEGISLYNSGEYAKAYDSFNKIKTTDEVFKEASTYMDMCQQNIKKELLTKVDSLSSEHYYTKALNMIEDVNSIVGNDPDIIKKVKELKRNRSDYLAKQNEKEQAASASIINNINSSNINDLVIESITPYLIHVSLDTQKVHVYNGNLRNWNLVKTFSCSTGIKGEDTPQGVYTIKEKGEWFYSDKYDQGGKYWVQFLGDYLFHSLPYDKTKTNVLDYTLGKPASHGCIRLTDENSKWIYDNIPSGSKVIIK